MKKLISITNRWRAASITRKFSIFYAALLGLVILVAITSIWALSFIRGETEKAIVTSTDIQHMVLEMDSELEEARRLEKDFFLRYPVIGYSSAVEIYAQPVYEQIAHVIELSIALQKLLSNADVSEAWQTSDINLNLFLSASARHAQTFQEATELIELLASQDIGIETRLKQNSSLLKNTLLLSDDQQLMDLYREMIIYEKEYFITRQRPYMQSAFNVAVQLKEEILGNGTLTGLEKGNALSYLETYLMVADDILELDVAIQSKFNEFDLQVDALDPITAELIRLTETEIERARDRINQISSVLIIILVIISFGGLVFVGFITRLLNKSITRNVVALTRSATEFEAGNLAVRAEIKNADELGQLAASFNSMATQLGALIGNLEHTVASRTSELRLEKEKVQHYLDIAGVMLLVLDADGCIELINNRGLEILGYKEAEILGKNWFDTCVPKNIQKEISIVHNGLVSGRTEDVEIYENSILTKSGEERIIAWHNSVIRLDTGDIQGTLSSGEDITDRKLAENALAEKSTELERSNKELEQFAYVASHDLREPLRTVSSYLQLIERRYGNKLGDDAREFIDFAVDGANRMEQLIQDLLTYSRVGTRGKPFEYADLNDVLEQVVLNLRTYIDENQASVSYDQMPAVFGDKSQLIQLFQNLISNAIKFRKMGELPQIHVRAEMQNGECLISVADNGIGIDPKYSERIFIIFQRLHTNREYTGTGIGLTISKRIVERHGGRIWVESEPGIGSTFFISMPTGFNALQEGDKNGRSKD